MRGTNKPIDIITRVHKYIPYTKKALRHINFTKKANSHIPFSSGCPTDIPITISLQNHIHFNLITQSYYYNSLSKIFLLLEWSINIFKKNRVKRQIPIIYSQTDMKGSLKKRGETCHGWQDMWWKTMLVPMMLGIQYQSGQYPLMEPIGNLSSDR